MVQEGIEPSPSPYKEHARPSSYWTVRIRIKQSPRNVKCFQVDFSGKWHVEFFPVFLVFPNLFYSCFPVVVIMLFVVFTTAINAGCLESVLGFWVVPEVLVVGGFILPASFTNLCHIKILLRKLRKRKEIASKLSGGRA